MVPMPVLGPPSSPAGDSLSLVDPEGGSVRRAAVPRARPIAGIVGQDENGTAPSRLPVNEPLNALNVLNHVIGPDVLCALVEQLEALVLQFTGPCGCEVFQFKYQVLTEVWRREE
jgi:hypothetical protein